MLFSGYHKSNIISQGNSFKWRPWEGWLKSNLSASYGNGTFAKWPWFTVFSQGCWLLWKAWCKKAMEGTSARTLDLKFQCMHNLMETITRGMYQHEIFQSEGTYQIHWVPPPVGTFRLDVDGSVNDIKDMRDAEVIWDSNGRWIMGFRRLLGFVPSAAAEIQAIVSGLEMCSRLNIGNINMYSDAANAIFLMKGVPPDHLFSRRLPMHVTSCLQTHWWSFTMLDVKRISLLTS